MSEELFLGGKVRKQSLPLLEVPTGPDAPALKRLNLAQGQLAQLSPPGIGFHYLAWIELKEGLARGNHYHYHKQEWFYLIDGEAELTVEDPGSEERRVVTLVTGDLVVIETGVAHALRTVRSGQGIEFSPAPYDPDDTIPYALVP
ncbi:MAG: cupin domain-containing protein [Akkermansiaceae bacterium]|nr:cupin domain-containing protein [Akkermansiaceae bacterium]